MRSLNLMRASRDDAGTCLALRIIVQARRLTSWLSRGSNRSDTGTRRLAGRKWRRRRAGGPVSAEFEAEIARRADGARSFRRLVWRVLVP